VIVREGGKVEETEGKKRVFEKKKPFLRNILDLQYYGKVWVGMSTKRMGVL